MQDFHIERIRLMVTARQMGQGNQCITRKKCGTMDVQPPSPPCAKAKDKELEDWDLALEVLRDRQLWKKKGAERLR